MPGIYPCGSGLRLKKDWASRMVTAIAALLGLAGLFVLLRVSRGRWWGLGLLGLAVVMVGTQQPQESVQPVVEAAAPVSAPSTASRAEAPGTVLRPDLVVRTATDGGDATSVTVCRSAAAYNNWVTDGTAGSECFRKKPGLRVRVVSIQGDANDPTFATVQIVAMDGSWRGYTGALGSIEPFAPRGNANARFSDVQGVVAVAATSTPTPRGILSNDGIVTWGFTNEDQLDTYIQTRSIRGPDAAEDFARGQMGGGAVDLQGMGKVTVLARKAFAVGDDSVDICRVHIIAYAMDDWTYCNSFQETDSN